MHFEKFHWTGHLIFSLLAVYILGVQTFWLTYLSHLINIFRAFDVVKDFLFIRMETQQWNVNTSDAASFGIFYLQI